MIMIDTHSHLYDEAFASDLDAVMARGREAGVTRVLLPAIDSTSHGALFAAAGAYPGECLPMMGLHPTSVNDNPAWRAELETVEKLLAAPPVERFWGVGEIGLDLHWSKDFLREQTEAFHVQVELALRHDLPVAIHTRDAWPEMRAALGRWRGRGLRGVMHAFSGGEDDYAAVKEAGDFVFGVGGVVTYKNSSLAALVAHMPLEDLVLETDAPYLAPVPWRGKRNETAYLAEVLHRVAEIRGMDPGAVAAATTANAKRIFGI